MNTEQFTGHTPGPWTNEYDEELGEHTIESHDGMIAQRVLGVDADLIAAAPELLAELKEWREECEAQQAYARALHAQLARATEWAYQQFCYDKSKMEHFDNHVWGEENAP